MAEATEKIRKLIENIESAFVGRRETVESAVNALISGGHLLIIDLPGVGKTTLAKAIALSIDGISRRVQFTPDLLPTDITGVNIYIHEKCSFAFHKGPVFTNVLLADEINRATPRVQSSLLEAMEEGQVSVDGATYKLSQPFIVIATQNPVEIQGTFPLPEAQLDRFLISAVIGYPSRDRELLIMEGRATAEPLDSLQPVMKLDEIERIKEAARAVHISEPVKQYILDITAATRRRDGITLGASPRASLSLMRTARTHALISGREFVTPEDVKSLAQPTLAHRLILRGATRLNLDNNRAALDSILSEIPVPRPR
jgi:MoxR-like ATPase